MPVVLGTGSDPIALASDVVRQLLRDGVVDDSGAQVMELIIRRMSLSNAEASQIANEARRLAGAPASGNAVADVYRTLDRATMEANADMRLARLAEADRKPIPLPRVENPSRFRVVGIPEERSMRRGMHEYQSNDIVGEYPTAKEARKIARGLASSGEYAAARVEKLSPAGDFWDEVQTYRSNPATASKATIPELAKRIEASARMAGANRRGQEIDPRVAESEWDRIFVVHGLRHYGEPVQRAMRESFMNAFWGGAARGLANPGGSTPEWFEVGQRAFRETLESEPIPYIVRSAPAFRGVRPLSDEEIKRVAYHYYPPRPFESSPVPSQRLPRARKNSPEWDGMKAEIQRGWDAAARAALPLARASLRNPVPPVTDRALRYRANANPPASDRSDFAKEAWRIRRKKYGSSGRQNPQRPDISTSKAIRRALSKLTGPQRDEVVRYADKTYYAMLAEGFDASKAAELSEVAALNKAHALSLARQNPESEAAKLYEDFHGKPSERLDIVEESIHFHGHLAALGRLVELKIKTPTRIRATLAFAEEGPDVATLASSEDGRQLFIVGGNQELDLRAIEMDGSAWLRDLMDVGELVEVTYHTQKGFHKFEPINYFHKLGEETGVKPRLLYDTRNKRLLIAGGQYEVKPEGIVN